MRIMFDAVDSHSIPPDAQMVAGYLDGPISRWAPEAWHRFPNAVKVGIVVSSRHNDGHVLDVERGDAPPEHAPTWVRMRRAAGADPSVYCSLANWPTVRRAFARARIAEPHYWIAYWSGRPDIPPGAVAVQFAAGLKWDISAVEDYWPGVDNGQTI